MSAKRGEVQFFSQFAFTPQGDRIHVRARSRSQQLLAFPSLAPVPHLEPPLNDDSPKIPFETDGDFKIAQSEVKLRGGAILRPGPTQRRNSSDWGIDMFDGEGKFVRCFDKGRVVGFDVSPDQKRLACYGHQSNGQGREFPLIIWDLATGDEVSRINVYPRPDYHLRYSPDGKWLATRHADGVVRVWDVQTRQPVFALEAEHFTVEQFVFSKDGRYLVGGHPASSIKVVWDLRDEKK